MAVHHKDKKRVTGNKAYRLLGVNAEGKPYFYWSDTKGEYAAYLGPHPPYGTWGSLECKSGEKNIKYPERRTFIADYETARRLEELNVVAPCGNCNKTEYERYQAEGRYSVNPDIEIE